MLTTLEVRNFTVFESALVQLSPHLNVLVGENGSGKTHLLEVAYSVLAVSAAERRRASLDVAGASSNGAAAATSKTHWQGRMAEKLVAVFRADGLGRLARRQQGRSRAEIACGFAEPGLDVGFSFSTQSRSEVSLEKAPTSHVDIDPVFLPTRELLSISPGFVSLYEGRYLEFPETWRDTCSLLAAPALRGARERTVAELLAPLEAAMGGRVVLDRNGRFYLDQPGLGRVEIHLVAEGIRKLATLARLVATGSLLDKGYLFWDEPEANLNPKLVKEIARVILHLALRNIQVFLATHSLFLMREIDILLKSPEFAAISPRFFGLRLEEGAARLEQGDTVDDIGSIDALDEELSQSRRYLELAHDDHS